MGREEIIFDHLVCTGHYARCRDRGHQGHSTHSLHPTLETGDMLIIHTSMVGDNQCNRGTSEVLRENA